MAPTEKPLHVSVSEARALLNDDAAHVRVLDVREPFELQISRLENAVAIPMGQIPGRMNELSRDVHWLVLCHHGARSLRVTQFLRAQGLPAVSNISGGIEAWASEIDPSLARY